MKSTEGVWTKPKWVQKMTIIMPLRKYLNILWVIAIRLSLICKECPQRTLKYLTACFMFSPKNKKYSDSFISKVVFGGHLITSAVSSYT